MIPDVSATQNTAFMVFLLNSFARQRRTDRLQNAIHSVANQSSGASLAPRDASVRSI
jgi:hypothetical protein